MVKSCIDREPILLPCWANRQRSLDWYRVTDVIRPLVLIAVALTVLVDFSAAVSADWPMRGRNQNRNAVIPDQAGPTDWELADELKAAKNIRWSANLKGRSSCGDPVISGGLIWVGTSSQYDEKDASVLMCFREHDGQLLYKYVSPRLEGAGAAGFQKWGLDWPRTSLASSPLVEGDRLWFCTNRCEVIGLDIAPLLARTGEPRIVWKVDLRSELGVVPKGIMLGSHASHCSIAGYKDLIYVNTSNAAGNKQVPAPDAPSLVCFQKLDGAVRWKDNSPGKNIIDAQHGSPLVIEVAGRGQVVMGQGDGWVRGFDCLTGEMLWKFDINPRFPEETDRQLGGNRSDLVSMPVFSNDRVYFAVGRQFEMCGGQGRVCCVDPTKRGDFSSDLDERLGRRRPNETSGFVWEYIGEGDRDADRMHRTLASVVIHKGLVIAPDLSGIIHCLDARNGKKIWTHDTQAQIIGSPLIVGDKVYVGTDDGVLLVLELSRQKRLIAERDMNNSIEAGSVFANGVLYVTTRDALFAIGK